MVIRNVLLDRGVDGLGVQHVNLRDRLRARFRAGSLDRQLAEGALPEASVALALHAARVYGRSQRRLLADSLTRLSNVSGSAPARLRVPVDQEAVRRASRELHAVADRLSGDSPVNVCGVARVRVLIADGTGPLYRAARPEQLRRELRSALSALDVAS
jgi:hypothetical protein